METTFITIHDLSQDARILYASDSIVDILGHTPDEVLGRSCWDFFHPEELPLAKDRHSRSVNLDKAAVLSYCQLRNRQRQWVWCECCFTIVYDVMVVCTSIYRSNLASQKLAVEAPVVRRLFSSSPKDPRYHMLSHLSSKFTQSPKEQTHEPRAALFLNRFTRTLTIMYATAGIEQVIGISSEDMKGRSFYYCIQENCLGDAVNCLESAKGNDSIAYLRFWFRDPRVDDPPAGDTSEDETDTDVSMTDVSSSGDGRQTSGAQFSSPSGSGSGSGSGPGTGSGSASYDISRSSHGATPGNSSTTPDSRSYSTSESAGLSSAAPSSSTSARRQPPPAVPNPNVASASRTSSGDSAMPAVFDPSPPTNTSSSTTSPPTSPESNAAVAPGGGAMELEAVVSCTSDGLVVCLRRARPLVPNFSLPAPAAQRHTAAAAGGLFAAPWAVDPVFHPPRPDYAYYPLRDAGAQQQQAQQPTRLAATVGGGPAQEDLWASIRDVAVFAWALTGINGGLAQYARNPQQGKGESMPPDGLGVWEGEQSQYGYRQQQHVGASGGGGYGGGNNGDGGIVPLGAAATATANPYPSPGSHLGSERQS